MIETILEKNTGESGVNVENISHSKEDRELSTTVSKEIEYEINAETLPCHLHFHQPQRVKKKKKKRWKHI